MQTILKQREIDYLLHFTRVENLPQILKKGIYPRKYLDRSTSIFNDEYRHDRCENAVCTSIEFPNYKMFYSLRCKNPDTDWAVLVIDAQVLLDFTCAFCETNAASEIMYTTPLKKQMGKDAFLKLFKDTSFGRHREDLNIPDYFPTNPQAEVLVFGKIPPRYIKYVYFEKENILEQYEKYFPENIEGYIDSTLFRGRCDWPMWKETR